MRAIFHHDTGEEEHVKILDIFVDEEGIAKVLFIDTNGDITTAPINRFTDYEERIGKNYNLDWEKGVYNK
jgi:hypothetical protein